MPPRSIPFVCLRGIVLPGPIPLSEQGLAVSNPCRARRLHIVRLMACRGGSLTVNRRGFPPSSDRDIQRLIKGRYVTYKRISCGRNGWSVIELTAKGSHLAAQPA